MQLTDSLFPFLIGDQVNVDRIRSVVLALNSRDVPLPVWESLDLHFADLCRVGSVASSRLHCIQARGRDLRSEYWAVEPRRGDWLRHELSALLGEIQDRDGQTVTEHDMSARLASEGRK
jgi:hypothetical protein